MNKMLQTLNRTNGIEPVRALRAYIYARVSSKEQETEGYSIPAQLKYLRDYAAQHGLDVQQEFSESCTAKEAGRPEFIEMIRKARLQTGKQGSAGICIIVEKTDRLTRNFRDYITLEELVAGGVEIHLAKENQIWSNTSRSQDLFMLGIRALMAKNYVENLSEEVKKGQMEKASRGMWPGNAPIGYKNNRELRVIEPHPDEARGVVKAFEWAATGKYTLMALSKKLYDIGLRSRRVGKMIVKGQMQRILTNSVYYGPFRWGKRDHVGNHIPLIEKALFDQVQEVLSSKSKPQWGRHEFAFSGFLTCAACGTNITGQIHKGRYIYYHCSEGKGRCPSSAYLREEDLIELFGDAVKRLQIPQEVIDWTRDSFQTMHQEHVEERDANLSRLNGRYAKLKGFLDQAYNDKLEGNISVTMWEDRSKAWRKEQEEIERLVAAYRRSDTKTMMDGVRYLEIARDAYGIYQRSTAVQKRQILDFLLLNSRLNGKTLTYEYKKPFCWVAEGLFSKIRS